MKTFPKAIWLWISLLLCLNCATHRPSKNMPESREDSPRAGRAKQDTTRGPAGFPDCPWQRVFSTTLLNAGVREVWQYMKDDIIMQRKFSTLENIMYPDSSYAFIQTDCANMKGVLEIDERRIFMIAFKVTIKDTLEQAHVEVLMSQGEAGIDDRKWSCEISDEIRIQIQTYRNVWQSQLENRKWRTTK
jgi:hypothetical protein